VSKGLGEEGGVRGGVDDKFGHGTTVLRKRRNVCSPIAGDGPETRAIQNLS
jgi:hypothetical protein